MEYILSISLMQIGICCGVALYFTITYNIITFCLENMEEEAPSHIKDFLSTPFGSFILTVICCSWPLIMPFAWYDQIKEAFQGKKDKNDDE